jgi:hypothetical protein
MNWQAEPWSILIGFAVGIFLVLWLSVRLFTSLRRRVDRKNAATQLTEAVLWQLRREIAGELQRYLFSNARSVPDAGAPLRGQAKPTEVRVRLFVDFPNFEIGWNDFNRGRKRQIDWRRLPTILLDQLPPVAGVSRERLTFVGAHAYDSFIPFDLLALHGVTLAEARQRYLYTTRAFLEANLAAVPGYSSHLQSHGQNG